jgi:uncharacterized membrane protein YdjX (TVP38/TMEM64 family)
MKKYRNIFLTAAKSNIKIVAYLILFIVISVIVSSTLFRDNISIDVIIKYKKEIAEFVGENFFTTVFLYIILYSLICSFTPPSYAPLTTIGGFIFGTFFGTLFASIGAIVGGSLTFLGGRYIFRESIKKQYEKNLKKINEKIKKIGPIYFFRLRLIPGVPFFLMNAMAGVTEVSMKDFIRANFFGNIPVTAAYCYIGKEIKESGIKGENLFKDGIWILINSMILRGIVTIILILLYMYYKNLKNRGVLKKYSKKFRLKIE